MDNQKTLSNTVWEGKKRRVNLRKGGQLRSKRARRILMKRKVARLEGNGIGRRVRTLKKLVPNCESMGLEVLFKETADYIVSLQMRVRVMQIMVKALTGPDE